jgi:hypothetical protein
MVSFALRPTYSPRERGGTRGLESKVDSHTQSERSVEENCCHHWESNPSHPAGNLVTIHTELPCHIAIIIFFDRLCGLVVRVPGYRCGGPWFDSRALQEKESSGSGTESTQPREYN